MELAMIEAEQIKHGRMQVADLDRVFYDFISHLIGLAVSDSGLNAAACHPNRERARVMIPADILHCLTIAIFPHRRSAEFSTPDDERILKHPTLFEISKQGRSRLIHFTTTVGEA